MWWFLVVVLFTVDSTVCDYTFQKLEVNGDDYEFGTPNYPNGSPANWDMEYSFRVTDTDARVSISCSKLTLKEESPCSSNLFELTDGDNKDTLCGDVGTYSYESNGPRVLLKIKTGKEGGAVVKCAAKAVPNPLDLHLIFESTEVDSKEAGLAPASKTTTCPCGTANRGRIVGGKETKPNQYPFIVGIANKETMFLFCGASIITKKHALTAAHCTYTRTDKRKLVIIMGFHDIVDASVKYNRKGEIAPISQVIEHEKYDPKTMLNDIALLVTSDEIQYSTNVQPVCMPTGHIDLVGQFLRVLGWGKVKTGGSMSDVLRTVSLKVLPIEVCAFKFNNVPTDNPTQICSFGHGKDSCQGDSGGPLVWLDPETNRYTLVALVSYGKKECAGENPGLNTEVAAYLSWIQNHIRATSSGVNTCVKVN